MLRERAVKPQHSDQHYLHLSDLLLAIQSVSVPDELKILDYGAGVSPYRSLFPNSDYCTADIPGSYLALIGSTHEYAFDYLINNDGSVSEQSSMFDAVLSTQVAEHVEHPMSYFRECFRLLKPGGRLILTTHGSYEDHGCPYDYQRWTVDGMARDLGIAGFEMIHNA